MIRALLALVLGPAVILLPQPHKCVVRNKRLSSTRFHAERLPMRYSIGFVKVFETQHGVLRVSDLPKRTRRLAYRLGSKDTKSRFVGITEIFTDNKALTELKLVGDRKND